MYNGGLLMSAIRLTVQNYCTSCDFRKRENGKTICSNSNKIIVEAMKECLALKPFENYKNHKEN
ncbi:hypothetical protein D3C71_1363930 [compost metagenome]